MNLIEIMTGHESFDSANCKVNMLVVPDKLHDFVGETFIGSAAQKEGFPITKHNYLGNYSAWTSEGRPELGRWHKVVYDVEDGVILKLFVHKHLGHGRRTINVNQYIRARKDAAFREIKVLLTGNPKARFNEAIIKGRFDLLTKEQAEKRGVNINMLNRNMFNPDDVQRVMLFKEIEKERSAPGIIRERIRKSKDGGNEIIQSRRKARALDLND